MDEINLLHQKYVFTHTDINNDTVSLGFTQEDNLRDLLEKIQIFLSLCGYCVENKNLVLLTEEQINQIDN